MIDLGISEILLILQSRLLTCCLIRLLVGTILSQMVSQITLETRTESLTSLSCGVLLVLSCRMRDLLKILLGILLHTRTERLVLRAWCLETRSLRLKVGTLHLELRALILELQTRYLHRRVTHV
jgi:hypothetical protein